MKIRRIVLLSLIFATGTLITGVSALDGYNYYQEINYSACTDQAIYQQDIVVHRSTGTAHENTTGGLKIWHIYTGTHCKSNYSDVRFTNKTGGELKYYLWPDYNSSVARFCVRLEDANVSNQLMVWYENSAATGTSDGDATYILHDHFDGISLNTSKWVKHGESYSSIGVADGEITFTATGGSGQCGGIHSASTYMSAGRILEVRSRLVSGCHNDLIGCFDSPYYVAPHGDSTTDGFCLYSQGTSGSLTVSFGNGGNTNYAIKPTVGTTYHTFQIIWVSSSQIDFKQNNNVIYSITNSAYIPSKSLPVAHSQDGYSKPSVSKIDYILARAYSATPPAASTFSGEKQTAAPPTAQFTVTPTLGARPLTVQFTDTSTGSPTGWSWTFGDGSSSDDRNPQHTYTSTGQYTVTLNATNQYGSDTETKTNYIDVGNPPTAQFTASPLNGYAPLTVRFTDTSTNSPTSWSWDLGDGNTSALQNPTHTYTSVGTYNVTLTAGNKYGSDTSASTTITASTIYPFPGLTLKPTDIDSDTKYEDINGNNRLDYNDLTIFFQNLAWAKTHEPVEAFDFNENERLDYDDIFQLFDKIKRG